ncbi:GNAT family N-acetyltransferase [Salinadaptatus halalkaliphilus]|uniref:GNAT family N-acetyltransferase n=1 Tax=Salinadaptatus halalkaliphilus TaxID=2419781 RepID=A0A4V3VLN0_9EURY|nr:GNAT family N-acetyltransferase [Salinadaptatus halalkaliphilus]THE66277.1 GNAT family N-acetyltransferase [Salinadaptatus halalkaliphilus]
MSPTLTVEHATSEDIPTITDLWVDLARGQRAHGSVVKPEYNRETMSETLGAYQVADGLLVARLDDTIVGFASVSIERGSLELETTRGTLTNLYVVPDARNAGVGSALLETAERTLARKGAETMVLEVMAANEAARRFYRRHGYETHRVTMDRSLADRSENDTHSKEDR